MGSWFSELSALYPNLLWIGGSISFLTFFGTLLILPLILIRIPSDYFIHSREERLLHTNMLQSFLRLMILILKNSLGAILLLSGLVMLFTPGQGLLTILAGTLLMNFPGKRKLESSLISRNSIFNGINRIRRRARREELIRPPVEPPQKKAT